MKQFLGSLASGRCVVELRRDRMKVISKLLRSHLIGDDSDLCIRKDIVECILLLRRRQSKAKAIEFEKHVSSDRCGPLVAVVEGVIPHDFLGQIRRELEDVCLTFVMLDVDRRVGSGV